MLKRTQIAFLIEFYEQFFKHNLFIRKLRLSTLELQTKANRKNYLIFCKRAARAIV